MVAFSDSFHSESPTKASLLLVEDERPVLELLVRLLSKDYQVYPALDCKEAEAILESEDIDIIICDHGLPGESGIDFLSRVRNDYPAIQRILLTGNREMDLVIRAINEGDVHRYLAKPADCATVCEAIDTGLDKRRKILEAQRSAAEAEAMQKKMRTIPFLCSELAALTREAGHFMGKAMAIYFVGSIGFLFFGLGVLTLLYIVKSVMGVDMLQFSLDEMVTKFHSWVVSFVSTGK